MNWVGQHRVERVIPVVSGMTSSVHYQRRYFTGVATGLPFSTI